jgi:predicted transcriptional regulator
MGDIKISKRAFTKTVEGTKSLGHARLTVRGKKRPLSVNYEVLVETPGEKSFRTNGSYIRVRMEMEKNEKAKEGADLLREVAGKIKDPKGSMTENFDDSQLSCLAVLTEGERSIKGIVSSSDLGAYQVSKALAGLQSSNLVCRCERKGEAERRYRLTESGKQMTELLREEEPFLDIKRNIKRTKEERADQSHGIFFNDNELLCLVLLDKGPKTTKEIEEITGLEHE